MGRETVPDVRRNGRAMITATTRLVALLGHPVAHSLSPRMQNAAFAARALDWAYVACDVDPGALPAAVAGLRALGFAGANVTIPHKGAVAELCDELDDLARRSGAVNTLVFRAGRVVGANTDGPAVVSAVEGSEGPVRLRLELEPSLIGLVAAKVAVGATLFTTTVAL